MPVTFNHPLVKVVDEIAITIDGVCRSIAICSAVDAAVSIAAFKRIVVGIMSVPALPANWAVCGVLCHCAISWRQCIGRPFLLS